MVSWQLFLWTVLYGLFGSVAETSGSYNSLPPQADKIKTTGGETGAPVEDGMIIGKGQLASDELRIATGEASGALTPMAADLTIEEILGNRPLASVEAWIATDECPVTSLECGDLTVEEETQQTNRGKCASCRSCCNGVVFGCCRRCRFRHCSCGVLRRCCVAGKRLLFIVINPALVSLAIAALIAAWPWAKRVLFIEHGFGRPFGEAVQKLGNATPIVATVVMSASLGRAVRAMCGAVENASDKSMRAMPKWAGVVLIANRLMFVPVLGLAVMLLMEWTLASSSKPLLSITMRTVILLELASPAANNCIVLCQRFGLAKLAEDLAAAYAPMYLICLLTVPAYLSIGLYIFSNVPLHST